MAVIPPRINTGPDGLKAWPQPGSRFGRNESGYWQELPFAGTAVEIATLVNQLDAAGWLYEVENVRAGITRVTARANWLGNPYAGETPENVWELDPNEVEKDLLEADFQFGLDLSSIHKSDKLLIRELSENSTLSFTDLLDELTAGLTFGADLNVAVSLVLLLKAGTSVHPVEASVIRHTQLVSNLYRVQASYNNCNRILSGASMTSIENVPGTLLFAVPTSPTPTQFIEVAGDLQYGWRKVRPQVTRLAYNKFRIVQSYQFGLWAIKLWGAVL